MIVKKMIVKMRFHRFAVIVAAATFACWGGQIDAQQPKHVVEVEGITEYQLDNGGKIVVVPRQFKTAIHDEYDGQRWISP